MIRLTPLRDLLTIICRTGDGNAMMFKKIGSGRMMIYPAIGKPLLISKSEAEALRDHLNQLINSGEDSNEIQ